MPRDYRVYLEDILAAIGKIRSYTEGASFETLSEDEMLVDAILHNLEVIGEAAKHVPENLRLRYPQVEWRKITGMRDLVAHEYFGVSLEIVWDVLQNKLPELREQVTRILEEQE